ncbi:MAG TPA: RNA polymerase sigma factor [Gemmatimonadota bacterium]|nr:RNA polymerase sigma factor [Gemmatimonadota bacterium]
MNRDPAGTTKDGAQSAEEAESAEEAALIARIAGGESHRYGVLVDRYQRRLWWMCLRMLGDPDEADEVVQEAFIRAWERLGEFDPGHRFYPWLFTIARNRCLNVLRRRRTWGLLSLSGDDPTPVASRDEAGTRVEDRELARALEDCLAGLPDDQREAFDLRHGEGFRYAEIAAVLEVPEGTVMSRLHRAREKMQDCLEGKGLKP